MRSIHDKIFRPGTRHGVRRRRIWMALACLTVVMPAVALPAVALSQDGDKEGGESTGQWPQFLGPHRNGVSAETGLLKTWPADGPKEVWRVAGGVGMSGLAISQGKLTTMVQRGGKQWIVAHDAKTGKSLWQASVGEAYRNGQGNGPRATPTIVGQTVYAFSGEGILLALNLADGKILWRVDVVKSLGGRPAEYGMSCSPLVAGDLIYVTAGAPGAAVVALHRKSGKIAWKSGDDTAGYSSPALLKVGGRRQLVVFTGKAAVGLSPMSGIRLWRYPFATDYDCNIATPVAVDGKVFISAGENHGCAMLTLKPQGDRFSVEAAWKSLGARSVMRNAWQTSVLLDGYLYGVDNVGAAGPVMHLNCVKAATGERVWQKTRFGKSNCIAADGKLFFSTMKGELVVVRATPKSYEEIGRSKVIGTTRQAPALAGGLLYLRDDREIVCLDVRGK